LSVGIDLIGDIHGHAEKLRNLLRKMGYKKTISGWSHPERVAIFVGDLIDRGPEQLGTLKLVRDMVEMGNATVVMGNHEFNAIGWMTRDPDNLEHYLRQRHGDKGKNNRRQHSRFLEEVGEGTATHEEWVDWMKRLPLWIDEKDYRVVHACWDGLLIEKLRLSLNAEHTLNDTVLIEGFRKGSAAYNCIDTILKGVEVPLPSGQYFTDKDGVRRSDIRVRWWDSSLDSYKSAYIGPPGVSLPDTPIINHVKVSAPDKPTFFGHYWFEPESEKVPVTLKAVCLDYSVAAGGPLVAYRFDGEQELSESKFIW
tara:strand:+ start:2591 stop:3520 length:930 start_codon:yes stop_codon:yes gene_type:complete